jgi:nitrate reductase NapE component
MQRKGEKKKLFNVILAIVSVAIGATFGFILEKWM